MNRFHYLGCNVIFPSECIGHSEKTLDGFTTQSIDASDMDLVLTNLLEFTDIQQVQVYKLVSRHYGKNS